MKIRFFGQPFHESHRIGSFLQNALPKASHFWALVAWAQLSGLRLLEPYLRDLRSRGGHSELIVGIDGGIATREGLELALSLFDAVDVFYDGGSRTYHPKIYCVERGRQSQVVIGSSNLTEGGLFRNYEGNLWLSLSEGRAPDDLLLRDLRAFRDQMRTAGMPCRRLNRALLDSLARLGLAAKESERVVEELATRELARESATPLFGRRKVKLPSSPRAAKRHGAAHPRSAAQKREASQQPLLSWWKQLTRSDAIRKDERSHQRNYVILGQSGFDLDQKTWFREELFDRAQWGRQQMRTGQTKEVTDVPFEMFVEGAHLGTFEVRIDHAAHRVADQNNSPTWLHWSSLMPTIRRQDFTGWYLVIEKYSSHYKLRLSRKHPDERRGR